MELERRQSTGYGDHNVLWLEISLGKELVFCLREILEEELVGHIADLCFDPHITILLRGKGSTAGEHCSHKTWRLVGRRHNPASKEGKTGDPPAPIESWSFSSKD